MTCSSLRLLHGLNDATSCPDRVETEFESAPACGVNDVAAVPASVAAAAGPGLECADMAASGGPSACATAGNGGPEGAPAAQSGAAPRALQTEKRSGLLLLVPLMLGLQGKVSLLQRTRSPEEEEGVLSDIDDVTLCLHVLPQRTWTKRGCDVWTLGSRPAALSHPAFLIRAVE